MKYKNAAEILPEELLKEVQKYMDGDLLYVPKTSPKKEWGIASGSKSYYIKRNCQIRKSFQEGMTIQQLSRQYGLAASTIKRILYQS